MVELLFNFLESERDSNWKCHIECFKAMLPYDRIFDHNKYFKWGLVYLVDMLRLPNHAPDVYREFLDGNHMASRFNTVSTDMALEQTLNRESKVKGGIIGITHDNTSVEKWTMTSHLRSAVVENLKLLSGVSQDNGIHKELLLISIDKSETRVASVIEALGKVSDPFAFSEWSINKETRPLIKGTVLSLESAKRLLNAATEGEEMLHKMIKNPEKFLDPIKKSKVATFATTKKSVKSRPVPNV